MFPIRFMERVRARPRTRFAGRPPCSLARIRAAWRPQNRRYGQLRKVSPRAVLADQCRQRTSKKAERAAGPVGQREPPFSVDQASETCPLPTDVGTGKIVAIGRVADDYNAVAKRLGPARSVKNPSEKRIWRRIAEASRGDSLLRPHERRSSPPRPT